MTWTRRRPQRPKARQPTQLEPTGPRSTTALARSWAIEEDVALLRAIAEYGVTWKTVVKQLPLRRTLASARNRYIRIDKGKKQIGRNRCAKCGERKRGHTCPSRPQVEHTDAHAQAATGGRPPPRGCTGRSKASSRTAARTEKGNDDSPM